MQRARHLLRLGRAACSSLGFAPAAASSMNAHNANAIILVSLSPSTHRVAMPVDEARTMPPYRFIATTSVCLERQGNTSEEQRAFQEVADVFQSLISASYELVSQGRPADAELVLRQGAEHAAEALGSESAVEVAPLWDQLALIQFMHDRCDEAIESSRKAWNAVREFAAQEKSPEAMGAAATAAVRHASALVGGRHIDDASEIFHAAISDLENAASYLKNSNEIDVDEAEGYIEKFRTALGEARYYNTLCNLAALDNPSPEDVDRLTPAMEASLKQMTATLGEQHPLTACALREHNRMTEAAVEAERRELAEALYAQEIRLHEAFDKDGEQVAALLYQLGTLNYCWGDHEASVRSMEKALDILGTKEIEGAEDHILIVKHRLGMALGAAELHDAARQVLHGIALDLISQLGDGNPASRELDFMMALMGLRDTMHSEHRDQDKETALFAEMNSALEDLRTYGDDHMLVKATEKQIEDIKVQIKQ